MKCLYDRKATPGDCLLALLPIMTIAYSPFQAKFTGPFTVLRQVSYQNYLLLSSKRCSSTQLCHVNLLNPYFDCVPPVPDSSGKEQEVSWVSFSGNQWETVLMSLLRGRLKNAEN